MAIYYRPTPDILRQLRSYLDYDPLTGIFTWYRDLPPNIKAGSVAGTIDGHGYRQITFCGKRMPAAQLAYLFTFENEVPSGFEIDHRNRNRDDNSISNLRLATRSMQQHNSGSGPNKTGVRGVYYHKKNKNYVARITINNKCVSLGSYPTLEQAEMAYKNARQEVIDGHSNIG